MNNNLLRTVLLLIVIIITSSCSEKGDQPLLPTLKVTKELTFDNAATSQEFVIETEETWVITTNDNWITTKPQEGSGNTTITVEVENDNTKERKGQLTVTLKEYPDISEIVTIIQPVPVKPTQNITIGIIPENIKLYVSEKYQLELIYNPDVDYEVDVDWSSDSPDVAVVSDNGIVIAKKEGTATIICQAQDSKSYCQIVVEEPYFEPKYLLTIDGGKRSNLCYAKVIDDYAVEDYDLLDEIFFYEKFLDLREYYDDDESAYEGYYIYESRESKDFISATTYSPFLNASSTHFYSVKTKEDLDEKINKGIIERLDVKPTLIKAYFEPDDNNGISVSFTNVSEYRIKIDNLDISILSAIVKDPTGDFGIIVFSRII